MLWGGRFKEKPDTAAIKFSSSLSLDKKLIIEDLQVSRAHAEMLAAVKIINEEEAARLIQGLNLIETEYRNGNWNPEEGNFEDIHSAVESRLYELIGDTAGKLHSGRSRNDQAAADLRLWVKKSSAELINSLKQLQEIFIYKASMHIDTVMPGYTHLQRAQPVSFAFHLLAYVEMFERDKKRLLFTGDEADVSPLGSGALAGSTLPLDRNFTSEKLGFKSISSNALDTVSDRDYVLDFLNCCTAGMLHLSRLAEELIFWSSSEFSFVRLSDKYTTGSSLMPQKKNPDIAELIRGKTGRVLGNYVSLAAVLKGLPLSYNRDLQEDKNSLFDSVETLADSLFLMGQMIESAEINSERFREELKGDFSLCTDLADWLVIKNVPFREAHNIVGKLVKYCEDKNKKLNELNLDEMKKISPVFDSEVMEIVEGVNVLSRKKTPGSPNPDFVKSEIEKWNNLIHNL